MGNCNRSGDKYNGMPDSVVFLGKDSTNTYTRAVGFNSVRVCVGGHCK